MKYWRIKHRSPDTFEIKESYLIGPETDGQAVACFRQTNSDEIISLQLLKTDSVSNILKDDNHAHEYQRSNNC